MSGVRYRTHDRSALQHANSFAASANAPRPAHPCAPILDCMDCPRCGRANPEGVQFCTQCHETLLFKCPVCWHVQMHGGDCDECGANFGAYWRLAVNRESKVDAQVELDKTKARMSLLVSVLMAPLLGGRWVLRILFGRLFARLFAR